MFDSGYLFLLIGPVPVPLPAPLPVTEALQSVEVDSSRDRSGFQLTFTLGKASPLQLALLPLGFFDPIATRVIIVVVVRGLPQVIMDGIVTRQEVQPGNKPGEATLTITGEDLSVLMDIVELRIPWLAMPEAARIATILAKYAAFGVVPMVIPPPVIAVDSPTSRFDTQDGTDRAYLRQLATQSGYVFQVEPGPLPGQSIAYFGPDIRLPVVQRALSVNMDADTNVERISFSLDGLAKKQTIMFLMDPVTRKIPIPIPIPPINPLRPPLGLRPVVPARVGFAQNTTHLTASEAAKRAFGIMLESATPVSASGALDVGAYGVPLRARMMVGVRGAGITYDGLYFVDSVTHNIKRGEYKQNFQLSRDGMVSQTPVVVP
ncbi:hypothetical protein [Polymorphobacter fuscus]|uniref:Phage late control D family protein n=1 Tax=Sandarakinorhabdus fusca TaxID=1439888 RepID=A0A7C9GPX2_9SPHN|nr:hypothetical protein [Polymorphobacter fuscus]KAB7647946.1 hypothetical protein F9290_08345 [Polymorphobacter fuscus]MQT17273.1 hypothetical protein [Polymorphobacter fuscus]NJC08732.1 hypothetical protein [Polymorphobacter fuscus]